MSLSNPFATSSCLVLLASLVLVSACGPGEEGASAGLDEDDADAAFLVGGKADSTGATACQEATLLAQLNGPLSGVDDLKSSGVHTRAAKSISAHVRGPDGQPGTSDDNTIASLQELDDIKYVGPSAMRQMLAIDVVADATCSDSSGVSASVIFSPQPSQSTHLVRVADEIDKAEDSLDIAIYSFSNSGILNSIEAAALRGVKVRVIYEAANKHKSDPQGTMSAKLEDMGVDVRYVNKIMHHKFMIVDGPRTSLDAASSAMVISGSANWSNSAGTRYDENTVFIKGHQELNLRFQREFNRLWNHSRDLVWGAPKVMDLSELTIEEAAIPDHADLDAAFTSANFKTTTSSRYGETFSRVRGLDEVADFIIEQIEQADSSIIVASGHFRSRPIAEALIKKRQDNPAMEIMVYLDGQEFISSWWNDKQQTDLLECIDKAGTSETKKQDCVDKGFYFGYALGQAGIDVRYKAYSYRWHYKTAAQMHHKYLIFDRDTVVQGSYNLSDNAEHNTMENMVLFTGATFSPLVDDYIANFDSMWDTGRGQGLYDDLMNEVNQAGPGDSIPIVFDSVSLTWDEINTYKETVRDVCPAINSTEYRENPDKKFRCVLPN